MHAHGSGFLGGDSAEGLRVFDVAIGAERHRMRKIRGAHQSRADAAFEVGGEEQWQLRFVLQAIEQFRGFVRLGAQKKGAVHMN